MRVVQFSDRIVLLAAAFATGGSAFDAAVNTNLAVYWGQGAGQQRLSHFCKDSSIDIIPISFLNVFPDQGENGYPGTNFGNQCGGSTYTTPSGDHTQLLSDCSLIGPDIKTCQSMGKKILLSLGGAIPTNQSIDNDASAVAFSEFLWGAFGPVVEGYDGPRPFGDAVLDGFDFDIESILKAGQDPSALYRGYATMIDTLRGFYDLEKKTKDYYISGAPQCAVPDAHLANAIEHSWFDFVFVQFYNTPQCSARAYFDSAYGAYGGPPTDISFDAWAQFISTSSMNSKAKIYLGLPASPNETYDKYMYLQPDEAGQILQHFQCKYPELFGGVMVYEATASETNAIDGTPYADAVKGYLKDSSCATKPSNTSTKSVPTFPVSSVASMTNPSSTIVSTQSVGILSANSSSRKTVVPSSAYVSIASYNSSTSTVSSVASTTSLSSAIVSTQSIAIFSASSSSGRTAVPSSMHVSMASYNSSTSPVSFVASPTSSSSAIVSTQSTAIFSANSSSDRTALPSSTHLSPASFNSSSSHTGTASISLTYVTRPTGGPSNKLPDAPSNYNSTANQGPTVSRSKMTDISSYFSQKPASTSTGYNISSVSTSMTTPIATSSIFTSSISSYSPSSQNTASTSTGYKISSISTSNSTPNATSNIFKGSISSYSPSSGVPSKLNNHSSTLVYQYPSIRTSVVSGIPSVGSYQSSIHTSFISDTVSTTLNSRTTDSASTRSPISSFSNKAEVVRSSVVPSVSYATMTEETFTTKIITSYTTTCPVTYEATYGWKTYTEVSTTVSVAYSTITSTVCPRCSAPTQFATTKGISDSQRVSQTISYSPKIVVPTLVQASTIPGGRPSSALENTSTKTTGSSPLESHDDQSSRVAGHALGSVGTEGARHYQQASHLQSSPYPALASVTGSAEHGSKGTPPAGNSEIQGNGHASVGLTESSSVGAESQPPAPATEGHGKPSMLAALSQTLTTQMTGIVTKVVTATIVPVAALPTTSSAMNDISRASSAVKPLITETLIPGPVSPSQHNKGPGSAPYISGNATSTYGTLTSKGSSTISASVKTGSNAVSSVQPASVPFTGGASKEARGILTVIGVAIGAALIF